MSVIAVVQFGFAMMPSWWVTSPGLISGITSGTFSCILKAEELSMTVAPHWTAIGAYSRDIPAPALKNARSTPSKEFMPNVSEAISSPRNLCVLPADRAEASSLTEAAGNFRRSMT